MHFFLHIVISQFCLCNITGLKLVSVAHKVASKSLYQQLATIIR